MMDVPARSIEQMQYRNTAYEVVLEIDGAHVCRLGFCRKAGLGISSLLIRRGNEVAALLTEADLDAPYKVTADRVTLGVAGRVVARFTGRTERDCSEAAQ